MLKQSLYLYDNNVTVYFSPETGGFTTNRSVKVYDRKLNFFKGIDNTVLFSFKNDDQKPVGITGKTIFFNLMDPENKTTAIQKQMTVKDGIKGIAQLKIAENDLLDHPAKFYTYSVHIKDEEDNELPVYSDTQYMPGGTAEVMENIYPELKPSTEISSFTKRSTQLISSTVDAAPEINSNNALHSIAVYTTDFTGRLEIFGTMDASASLATDALQVGDSDKYKNFFVITPDGESNPFVDFSSSTGVTHIKFTGVYKRVAFQVSNGSDSSTTITSGLLDTIGITPGTFTGSVTSTEDNPSLTVGQTFRINFIQSDGKLNTNTVTSTGTTLTQLITDINNLSISDITASASGNNIKLTKADGGSFIIAQTGVDKILYRS